MATAAAPEALLDRVQELTERAEGIGDPAARAVAQQLLGAVMDLYGAGLERILVALDACGEAGERVRRELLDDGVVASLLLIHDLYPVDLETRVREALDSVKPYMESHGGTVELLGVHDEVATLRLEGSCKTCAASQSTLELAIKQALDEHCPDLRGIDVVGIEEPDAPPPVFELPMAQVTPGAGGATTGPALPMAGPAPATSRAWFDLNGASEVAEGALAAETVGRMPLVVANVEGTLLAYRDECAACGAPLHDGAMEGPVLVCAGCGGRFDLVRAGRAVDGGPQLGPVPLLRDGAAGARVALPA